MFVWIVSRKEALVIYFKIFSIEEGSFLMMDLNSAQEKEKDLIKILEQMEDVLVAFSGGVDSTYLLARALSSAQGRVVAVTAVSPLHPLKEIEQAKELAREMGAQHRLMESKELENAEFRANPPHRCYLCRKTLYGGFSRLAQEEGLKFVLDGSNRDDEERMRPGMKAALEHHVRSPLQEAGLGKKEIRLLSQKEGLPTWKKPAAPCLATRFPYGEPLSLTKLEQVEHSEEFMRSLGFEKLRIRYHGELARIEIESHMLEKAMEKRHEITIALQKLGFTFVTLDLSSSLEEKD